MTWVETKGLYWPMQPNQGWGSTLSTSTIDATGEKVALMGQAPKAGNISRARFRFGTVVKAGGSGLTVSLQDISAANTTAPNIPDETQDQTVAIANGDSGFASDLWYRTGTFSASRTVAKGDMLAVVIEYDGGGRLGSDSVQVASIISKSSLAVNLPGVRTKTASWATETMMPVLLLEYNDGSLTPFLPYATARDSATTVSFGSTSNPDEYAVRFTVPIPMKVGGAWFWGYWSNGADFDMVLYDGTTVLWSQSFDASQETGTTSNTRYYWRRFNASTPVYPGTVYRLAIKPTTGNQIALWYETASETAHLAGWHGGSAVYASSRVDGGAWTDQNTRRLLMGAIMSHVDDGRVSARPLNIMGAL